MPLNPGESGDRRRANAITETYASQFLTSGGTDVLEECNNLRENWGVENVETPKQRDVSYRLAGDGLEEVQKCRELRGLQVRIQPTQHHPRWAKGIHPSPSSQNVKIWGVYTDVKQILGGSWEVPVDEEEGTSYFSQ